MTSLPEEQPEQPREDSTTQLFRSWDCENWAESQYFFQLTLSYVCVSPVDHLAPSGKTLRDIAIVTGLLLQCSFQHCDTPYISTSLEFAVKFGLKCWYFHLIFSVLSFDKCMFTIGSCGLTFYCFHGGRALHSYTHTHTHTHVSITADRKGRLHTVERHISLNISVCLCVVRTKQKLIILSCMYHLIFTNQASASVSGLLQGDRNTREKCYPDEKVAAAAELSPDLYLCFAPPNLT